MNIGSKKIAVVSKVKDEHDIIESFCRYNLTYCDFMLILDNGSADDTRDIITKLAAEGLPVRLIKKQDVKVALMPTLAHMAIDELGADVIVPLDADEFLCHADGISPRAALEALNEEIEYTARWRTYIYSHEPDIALGFMPNNFTHYRSPSLESGKWLSKTIAGKFLLNERGARFCAGAHFLEYPNGPGPVGERAPHDKLVCAHFPLRSHTQAVRKAFSLWMMMLAKGDMTRAQMDALQYGAMFNLLRERGEIPRESMRQFCVEYTLRQVLGTEEAERMAKEPGAMPIDAAMYQRLGEEETARRIAELGDAATVYGPLDTSFCADKLALRYTKAYNGMDPAFWRAVTGEIDAAAEALLKKAGESTLLAAQNGELNRKISDIYASNTWKTGSKLKKFFRYFVPK